MRWLKTGMANSSCVKSTNSTEHGQGAEGLNSISCHSENAHFVISEQFLFILASLFSWSSKNIIHIDQHRIVELIQQTLVLEQQIILFLGKNVLIFKMVTFDTFVRIKKKIHFVHPELQDREYIMSWMSKSLMESGV